MNTPSSSQQDGDKTNVDIVLECTEAWNGHSYTHYPAGQPKLTLVKLTIPAHSSLPWHTHPMPNIAYLLSGSLTVEDKENGFRRTFHAGEAINESVASAHRGYTTEEAVELIITYAGVEGQALSEPLPGEPTEF